jgi:uncharacterized membrane protein YgcG
MSGFVGAAFGAGEMSRMRKLALSVAVPLLLASATASAHFNLNMPPSSKGDTGGGKGSPPCGPDATEGTAMAVTGGTNLPLALKETTRHGGFYRVALALTSCHTGKTCFPADNTVYDSGNKVLMPGGVGTSDHADSMATPVFPVLADNLFPHPQAPANAQDPAQPSWNGMVPIPNVACDKCTLQVIEFMAPHGTNGDAGFFYHHCADLKITADPNKPIFNPNGAGGSGAGGGSGMGGAGGGGGAGGLGGSGAGAGGVVSGGTGGAPSSGGVPGSSGTAPTAGTATTPTAGTGGSAAVTNPGAGDAQDSGGCGVAKNTQGGASVLAALGLLFALGRRRRSR